MSLVQSIICQLLHLVLVLAAAPTLAGGMAWLAARLAGRDGPPLLQPWTELGRLGRKENLLSEDATPVFRWAPTMALAATAAVAALVPSFSNRMVFAPLADLVTVASLLWMGRMMAALAAMDAGTASGGLAAGATLRLNLLAEPARLLAILTVALLAGSGNLDLIVDLQREGMLLPATASALAAAALVTLGFADLSACHGAMEQDYAGRELAICRFTGWLRQVAWFDLIGALFLPIGMATPDSGIDGWAIGIVAWLARLAGFGICVTVLRLGTGIVRDSGATDLLSIALLLGIIALVIVLAGAGTV